MRDYIVIVSTFLAAVLLPRTTTADPQPLFRESFDDGPHEGVVGKAGDGLNVSAPGKINMERGTFAFFVRPDDDPAYTWLWRLAGIDQQLGEGYYFGVMTFQGMRDDAYFQFLDAGRYAPPLRMNPIVGRWKADEWHHLAAVWDRQQGITVYEDGKRVASNWGKYQWDWNLFPRNLFVAGKAFYALGSAAVDEVRVYGVPLTDAQIAQLARGEEPTGEALGVAPPAERRERELDRMGWSGASLEALPIIEGGHGRRLTFSRIERCVEWKRPVGDLFDGLSRTTWPHMYYGPDIKGRRMEIRFRPGQRYDRVTAFVQRPFKGELALQTPAGDEPLMPVEAEQASFWHRRLPTTMDAGALLLERVQGQLGQIAFYRAEALAVDNAEAVQGESFSFAPAEAYPDTDLGAAFLAETPLRFQQPVDGVRVPPAEWRLKSPPFGGFQAAMEPPSAAKAYGGVRLTLVAEDLSAPTPVRIAVKEPVHSLRDWLVADAVLNPSGAGRQVFTLELRGRPVVNLPPMQRREGKELVEVAGVPFGIMVTGANPVTWVLGEGGSSAAFLAMDMAAALPAAAEDQIEYMRQGFSTLMEGHSYGDPRIQRPLVWLAAFAPQRQEWKQLWRRTRRFVEPSPAWLERSPLPFEGFPMPRSEGAEEPRTPAAAPEWARWQRAAMQAFIDLFRWRIENQQIYTGEFGSTWNDDTCNFEGWLGYALCLDSDEGEFKASLRRFWDGLWTYSLDKGTGRYITDNCHYSEEGSSSMGMRLLVDYGDPVAVERAMTAAGKLRHWLEKTDKGYLMKSGWAGPDGVWSGGKLGAPHPVGGHDWDLVVPADYLIWYNRHPAAAEYVTGLFAEAGHDWRTNAPSGFFEFAAASLLDYGDFRRLCNQALVEKKRPDNRSPDLVSWLSVAGMTPEIREAQAAKAFQPAEPLPGYVSLQGTERQWFQWRLSGDMRWLIDAYRRECEWMNNFGWLITEGFPAHDRIYEPRGALICSRMGARVSNRGSMGIMWPLYGISYTTGARDMAALVTENLHDRLAVRFYAFSEAPLDVEANVWRLHPGTYRVTLASDVNDDGEPEETLMEKELDLLRGAPLAFTLPPRQGAILSITPIDIRAPDYDKPDLAVSLDTVDVVYNRHLVVKVHNLGTRPATNVLVRVRDAASGEIIPTGEQRIERIDAPLDFRPRYGFVQFDNIYAVARGAVVEIDPDGAIDDLNPFNNRLELEDAHILGPKRIGAERAARR